MRDKLNAHDALAARVMELEEALQLIVPYLEDGADAGDDAMTLLPIARAALKP